MDGIQDWKSTILCTGESVWVPFGALCFLIPLRMDRVMYIPPGAKESSEKVKRSMKEAKAKAKVDAESDRLFCSWMSFPLMRESEESYGGSVVSQVYGRIVGNAAYMPKTWSLNDTFVNYKEALAKITAASIHEEC